MKVRPRSRSRTFPRIARTGALGAVALTVLAISGASLDAAPNPSPSAPQSLPVQPSAAAPESWAAPGASAGVAAAPAPAAPRPDAGGGLVTIESDTQQADNRTGVVTATGNVRITYPDRRLIATSRQAQYFTREGRLVLSGDVDVIDADGQRIRAERLVYRLDSERLVAIPGQGRQVYSRLRLQTQPGGSAPTLLP